MGKLKIRVLGCGPAWGVPSLGFGWGNCDPTNPKNRRTRASILVESATTRLLIDASSDARTQLLDANVNNIDAILLTHEHADHTRGLDELGAINRFQKKLLPVYAHADTLKEVLKSMDYAFHAHNTHYLPFFTAHTFDTNAFTIGDITIHPFFQDHGFTTSWGFRINDFAYSTDVVRLPESSFRILEGVKVWILDCLKKEQHLTHSHLQQSLQWVKRIKPHRTILTHLAPSLDYNALKAELPPHVEPAYDGMEIQA